MRVGVSTSTIGMVNRSLATLKASQGHAQGFQAIRRFNVFPKQRKPTILRDHLSVMRARYIKASSVRMYVMSATQNLVAPRELLLLDQVL